MAACVSPGRSGYCQSVEWETTLPWQEAVEWFGLLCLNGEDVWVSDTFEILAVNPEGIRWRTAGCPRAQAVALPDLSVVLATDEGHQKSIRSEILAPTAARDLRSEVWPRHLSGHVSPSGPLKVTLIGPDHTTRWERTISERAFPRLVVWDATLLLNVDPARGDLNRSYYVFSPTDGRTLAMSQFPKGQLAWPVSGGSLLVYPSPPHLIERVYLVPLSLGALGAPVSPLGSGWGVVRQYERGTVTHPTRVQWLANEEGLFYLDTGVPQCQARLVASLAEGTRVLGAPGLAVWVVGEGALRQWDWESGDPEWSLAWDSEDLFYLVGADCDRAYFFNWDTGTVTAVNTKAGITAWTREVAGPHPVSFRLGLSEGRLLLVFRDRGLVLDASDGALCTDITPEAEIGDAIWGNSRLYLLLTDGRLQCYRLAA